VILKEIRAIGRDGDNRGALNESSKISDQNTIVELLMRERVFALRFEAKTLGQKQRVGSNWLRV
jgi:hypothetical protein